MTGWHPARWALRTRVALAFMVSTGVALVGLGVFVHARFSDALEDRLRDTVTAEADRLGAVPEAARPGAVRALGGEVLAQLVTAQGDVRASSRLLAGPMLGDAIDDLTRNAGPAWREGTVTVFDDDAAAEGAQEPERETFVLLLRPTGDGILVVGTSREDLDEAIVELRNQLLVAGPLALALAGGLGYVVAGSGLRPIERMRARAATISGRSAGERLPLPPADDELRRLAVTLNAMLERLDAGLQRERRFVAEASHDLRTPLTLMLTEIELALAHPRPPEELTEALASLNDEVRRLIALAEHLLESAGAQATLAIETRPVDLVSLAHHVADRFRPAATDRAIAVTGPDSLEVPGDRIRLDRALSNLVDNAVRHGAGDVTIEVSATRGGAVVVVADQGPGYSPDDVISGLGLSIVREIVRAHGGAVEHRRLDERTIVRVELPALSPS